MTRATPESTNFESAAEHSAAAAPHGPPDDIGVSDWDDLARFTGGLPPESIEILQEARELEIVYPLLHALAGGSIGSFFVRAAALESLVRAERAFFSSAEVDEVLFWLDERARGATVRALRQSGWLESDPRLGTTITDAGRWTYDVLSFLHRRVRENDLFPTVAGMEYAIRIGVDPLRHLMSMRSRLAALREEIEVARSSYSEVMLRRAAGKLQGVLRLSEHIRTVLNQVPVDLPRARHVARDVHDLLSRLHGVSAELHAAITEIGRQYLRLTAGLTIEQIVRALMNHSKEELSGVGRSVLLPALAPVPLLTTEAVALAAEVQALRERQEVKPLVLVEPPDAPRQPEAASLPEDVVGYLEELRAIEERGDAVALREFVPRDDENESFLRASLLSLVGSGLRGEGVAGALGALKLAVETKGDGWPDQLSTGALTALTPGELRPVGKETKRG